MWKTIREFEPDYLICPPIPADSLAGVHVDHIAVAEAVRKVAYMINVPHAFTPEYPTDETESKPCKAPVVIQTYDTYLCGENVCDLAIDVEAAFDVGDGLGGAVGGGCFGDAVVERAEQTP